MQANHELLEVINQKRRTIATVGTMTGMQILHSNPFTCKSITIFSPTFSGPQQMKKYCDDREDTNQHRKKTYSHILLDPFQRRFAFNIHL